MHKEHEDENGKERNKGHQLQLEPVSDVKGLKAEEHFADGEGDVQQHAN